MISVVIPSHNSKYLNKVLDGLCHQTEKDFEVIVVVNPEYDVDRVRYNTLRFDSVINHFKLIGSDIGSNMARDAGINNAEYDIIALLDDDSVPCPSWIEQIKALCKVYPTFGVFGGPQINEYLAEKPKWLVNDFIPNLSNVDWKIGTNGPIELLPDVMDGEEGCARYLVSGNMFFRKETYRLVGGLNTEIGYHGNNMVSNDEVEFTERCATIGNPGIMYSPNLVVRHQIGSERMTLEWFRKRSYGQGWADGDMARRKNPDKNLGDLYHDHFQYLPSVNAIVRMESILKAREKLADEEATRHFITNLCICKTDYVAGYQNGLTGKNLWEINDA